MAWINGRNAHTTAAQRKRILERDNHRCSIRGPRCVGEAAEVDHRDNRRGPEYDADDNLQAVCAPCHKEKTQREALARRTRHKRKPRQHPGLM